METNEKPRSGASSDAGADHVSLGSENKNANGSDHDGDCVGHLLNHERKDSHRWLGIGNGFAGSTMKRWAAEERGDPEGYMALGTVKRVDRSVVLEGIVRNFI